MVTRNVQEAGAVKNGACLSERTFYRRRSPGMCCWRIPVGPSMRST